jgi:hypothetical protein
MSGVGWGSGGDLDARVRTAAFAFLTQQTSLYGDTLPRPLLAEGFRFEGQRVPLLGPQGIFRPAILPELPHPCLGCGAASQLGYEALHAGVAAREALLVHEVVPDRLGIAPAAEPLGDQLAEGLTGAGAGRPTRRWRPAGRSRIGGHLPGMAGFIWPGVNPLRG